MTAAAELYRAILVDIEKHQGDVFRRRAFVSTGEKIRRFPAIWYKSRETVNFPKANRTRTG